MDINLPEVLAEVEAAVARWGDAGRPGGHRAIAGDRDGAVQAMRNHIAIAMCL